MADTVKRFREKAQINWITLLKVSGGGSQSDLALQLTADIFNLPVERPHTYETSALGAAMDAMVGLGIYPDMATAIASMTRVGRRFELAPATHVSFDHPRFMSVPGG